jgi:hypothetical protein
LGGFSLANSMKPVGFPIVFYPVIGALLMFFGRTV